MLNALTKAVGELFDPLMLRLIILSLFLSGLALFLLTTLAGWFLLATRVVADWGLEWFLDALGMVASFAMAWLLFPAVAGLITSLFLEQVVDLVEEKHYPNRGKPRVQSFAEILQQLLQLMGIMILLNLILMPIYVPLWFVGLGMIIYYLVNGYLLGREYFEMVAARRLPPSEVTRFRREHRRKIVGAGMIMAFGFTLPILNLIMPILGAAFMTHVFEMLVPDEVKLLTDQRGASA